MLGVRITLASCTPSHHNRFMALFPGPPGWAGARKELLDFMVQGKINRGRHTDHLARHHSIRTNQCPPPPSPIFYKPVALPAAQPTALKATALKAAVHQAVEIVTAFVCCTHVMARQLTSALITFYFHLGVMLPRAKVCLVFGCA